MGIDTAAAVGASEIVRGFAQVIVIAPHPDDEVLGCGGLVAAAATGGCDVRAIFVTDGSASHVGSPTFPAARIRAVREDEARASLRELGVTADPLFFRLPDGELANLTPSVRADIAERIAAVIAAAARPTLVLGPWRRDPHPDHRAAAQLVHDALADAAPTATLFEYRVWLDERGDGADRPRGDEGTPLTVDIRPFLACKQAALARHRSQLGTLIHDAPISFALPASLIARAGANWEHFVRAG